MQHEAAGSRALAFVLGGGGSRGALQAGAVRALLESGHEPELLVGTSAGAINAAFLGARGVSTRALDALDEAWCAAAGMDLLPSNYVWLTLRSVLRRSSTSPASRIREFFIANGVTPELRFADLPGPRVIMVSSDLNTGQPVLHGTEPGDSVLDALLLSTALPPWFMPVKRQGHYLMDGAVVSGLPIEPAMRCGATEIIALDLTDARDTFGQANGLGVFINRLTYAVEQRQVDLELQVARAQQVPVLHVRLNSSEPIPIWDFRCAQQLISEGYQVARQVLQETSAARTSPASQT